MLELLKAFGAITLRRLGPEDLPASGFLLGITLIVYLLSQALIAVLAFGDIYSAVVTVAADLAMLAVCLWALLALTGFRARYQQSLTAMLGTSALLSILSVPFTLWRRTLTDVPPGGATLPGSIMLVILAWSFVVDGHILSRSLSRPFSIGLLIAIAYFFLNMTLLFEFLPAEP